MRKKRFLYLKPGEIHKTFRTNYNCNIVITPNQYSVGIFNKEAGGFCANEDTTFDSYIEAAKYIIENDLIIKNAQIYEGDKVNHNCNDFYIACYKKGDEVL